MLDAVHEPGRLTFALIAAQPIHTLKHELHTLPLVGPQPARQHVVNQHWPALLARRGSPQRKRLYARWQLQVL